MDKVPHVEKRKKQLSPPHCEPPVLTFYVLLFKTVWTFIVMSDIVPVLKKRLSGAHTSGTIVLEFKDTANFACLYTRVFFYLLTLLFNSVTYGKMG